MDQSGDSSGRLSSDQRLVAALTRRVEQSDSWRGAYRVIVEMHRQTQRESRSTCRASVRGNVLPLTVSTHPATDRG